MLKQRSAITTTMTQFSDLPSCLVMDILSRLPLQTLATCRCVCKDWTRLFREPYFKKLHLAASPVHLLNRHIGSDETIQFGQFMEDKCNGDLEVKTLNRPANVCSRKDIDYLCINSCNGLLCLVGCDYNKNHGMPFASICVCNPILGEWVSISPPARNYSPNWVDTTMALVFSAKNNQYKLLLGFYTMGRSYGFEIYTLGGGTRQWRSIGQTLGFRGWGAPWRGQCGGSGAQYFHPRDSTTFLHGSLHWIDLETRGFICCFDVDSEKFRRLSLPSPNRRGPERKSSSTGSQVQLGVIKGCMCALVSRERGCLDKKSPPMEIWVMKEYGVETSWGRMLTIYVSGLSSTPHLLFPLNEEEILIYDSSDGLITYNLRIERCRRQTCREKTCYSTFRLAYKPSFISLKDIAKGEQVVL